MNILIIGSRGFIGSHVKAFLENDTALNLYECDVVMDYVSPKYFVANVSNTDYSEIFQSVDFEVCINCSGAASVPDSLKHPQRDFLLNASNVFFMLDAIRKYRPQCRFINLSSAAVYGNPQLLPIKEEAVCAPVSPYGYHKLMAENICSMFHEQFQLQTCSLRIFSAYGNGLKKQLFWDIYQKSKSKSNELRLYGTGNETRDFIHEKDIAQAIQLVIEKGDFKGTVYNVANGVSVTIKEAVTQLLQALGYTGSIVFGGKERAGDPIYWCSDITKMQALGYQASMHFEQGIKSLAVWLRAQD